MASKRQITVGGVPIGGGAPVAVQSMTKTETADFDATMRFYTEGFGFRPAVRWGEGDGRAVLLDTGDGNYLEVFAGGKRAPGEPSTTGTTGDSGSTYDLDGSKSVMKAYENQHVEVVGTIDDEHSKEAPPPDATTTASAAASIHPRLHVVSVRSVAGTCNFGR